jgi:hypothetical protein
MKNIFKILAIMLVTSNASFAQFQKQDITHILKLSPMALGDVYSQRLQMSYEILDPIKHISLELGGAYIFNEQDISAIGNNINNYWANGWNANTCFKFYDKENQWYGGVQAKLKYNYMHWDAWLTGNGFQQNEQILQRKQVLIGDIIGGYLYRNRGGFVNEIGVTAGLRFKTFKANGKTTYHNLLNGPETSSTVFSPNTNSDRSIHALPSITFFYKIGFGFSSKK